jgi:hypothetical protein
VRIALISTAAAALLALVGYWPTAAQAGSAGVTAMLVGIGICLIGGWAGSLPTVAYLPRPPRDHANGILIGLAARFAVTLGLAIGAWLTGMFPKAPLLLWVGIAQLAILAVDVPGLVVLLKRAAKER